MLVSGGGLKRGEKGGAERTFVGEGFAGFYGDAAIFEAECLIGLG